MSRETRVPSIPEIRDDNVVEVLRAIKSTLEVREGRNGNPLDQNATLRDLIALNVAAESGAGYSTISGSGTLPVISVLKPPESDNYVPENDLTTPPAPTGLRASGGFTNVYLEWNGGQYRNHAYTEIWRGTTDNLGDAVMVGTTIGSVYADPTDYGTTYYYWIRFVSVANITGPYNQTSGTQATTALNVADMYPALEDEIANSALAIELGTRIAATETGITELKEITDTSASQLTILSSVVGSNSSALKLQANVTDGLSAQYTVKIDNNGHVSGFGLASTAVNGVPSSAFIVRADRFAVVGSGDATDPLGTLTPTSVPFVVLTSPATIGGKTYPAGTWIKSAFIANATISSAQIESLVADKIATGTLTASVGVSTGKIYNGVTPGSIYPPGHAFFGTGWFLGDWGGTNQFYIGSPTQNLLWNGSALSVKGTITASAGYIGGCLITANTLESNYTSTTGWRLSSDGTFQVGNGTFRGAVTATSGSFTGSITASSGTIGGITISSTYLESNNYSGGSTGWRLRNDGVAEFNSDVTIRGALRSASVYTGSLLKCSISGQELRSVATCVYTTASATWTGGVLWGGTDMRFYGSDYHTTGGVTVYQRVRSAGNGGPIPFIISVNCVVDHYLSIWYRVNGGTWIPLVSITEPQVDYGSASITYVIPLSITQSQYVDFGVAPTDTSGTIFNPSKPDVRNASMAVMAVNF